MNLIFTIQPAVATILAIRARLRDAQTRSSAMPPSAEREAQAGRDPLLHEATALLDDVVQIRGGSTAPAPVELLDRFNSVTALSCAGRPSMLMTRSEASQASAMTSVPLLDSSARPK